MILNIETSIHFKHNVRSCYPHDELIESFFIPYFDIYLVTYLEAHIHHTSPWMF